MRKFLIVLVVLSMILSIVGCNPDKIIEGVNDIVATGTVYSRDTQVLSVKANTIQNTAQFKSDITKDDIVVEDGLEGKQIDSVEWISSTELKVTLSGRMENFNYDSTIGLLRIKKEKMVSGESSWCYVKVVKPFMSVKAMSWENSEYPANITVYCTYVLSYGKFDVNLKRSDFTVLASSQNNMYAPPPNGKVETVTISPSGKELTIRIDEFNSMTDDYPRVVFPAFATTFNKEIVVEVGKTFPLEQGYDMH